MNHEPPEWAPPSAASMKPACEITQRVRCAAFAICSVLVLLLWLSFGTSSVLAQTTPNTFNYQGHLTDGGALANGAYNVQFRLFDTKDVGTGLLIGTITLPSVQVTNGSFAVPLDFGAGAFPGAARYLEIIVNGTALNPRQPITATPYAIRSLASDTATNATQLGGVDAARYVQSDAGGNVSIASGLTVNGTLSLNAVNAATQYNLAGQHILSSPGGRNLFAGLNAGKTNSTGDSNTFLGIGSGQFNTTGNTNTFVGTSAGFSNTTGNSNSFFGGGAGQNNGTGDRNSYFGWGAGLSNQAGVNNAFFGYATGGSNFANNNSFWLICRTRQYYGRR
jgi:hypothetical protein